MKINVCDICLADGKLAVATYIRTLKHPIHGTLKLQICTKHFKEKTPMSREQMTAILEKAYRKQFEV